MESIVISHCTALHRIASHRDTVFTRSTHAVITQMLFIISQHLPRVGTILNIEWDGIRGRCDTDTDAHSEPPSPAPQR